MTKKSIPLRHGPSKTLTRAMLTLGQSLTYRQVARQQEQGFRLAAIEADGHVRAVAGYRVIENLAWGKFLYVDDLVTDAAARSEGWGGQLLDWLIQSAREEGCQQFHLDSGVQRFGAHRFYLMKRMQITCHHFAMTLGSVGGG